MARKYHEIIPRRGVMFIPKHKPTRIHQQGAYVETKGRILELLTQADRPLTTREVGEAIGGIDAYHKLLILNREGVVCYEERLPTVGRYPTRYWSLNGASDESQANDTPELLRTVRGT